MSEPGGRRSVPRIVALVAGALVCGAVAFFGFLIGMACEPDAGLGCDRESAARVRAVAYGVALATAACGAGSLAAAAKPTAPAVATGAVAGLALVGYAITQVN